MEGGQSRDVLIPAHEIAVPIKQPPQAVLLIFGDGGAVDFESAAVDDDEVGLDSVLARHVFHIGVGVAFVVLEVWEHVSLRRLKRDLASEIVLRRTDTVIRGRRAGDVAPVTNASVGAVPAVAMCA